MSILKYKYKAHKLVNILFYLFVFLIGFVFGLGFKELDFNKLISNILMIDNVKAYTIYEDESIKIDEEYINNSFLSAYENFSYDDFPYVECMVRFANPTYISCSAFSQSLFENLILSSDAYGTLSFKNNEIIASEVSFMIDVSDSYNFSSSYKINELFKYYDSSAVTMYIYYSNNYSASYTNFNISSIPNIDFNYDDKVNKLDFNKYTTNLTFNENLFKDNPDFKEVCVNNYDTFAIISNDYSEYGNDEVTNRVFSERDFIWFKNGVKGLSTYFYHNKSENNVKEIDKDDSVFGMYANYSWLNSLDEINYTFSSEDSPFYYMLNEKGYTDKYLYYDYTLYPFMVYFNNNEEEYMFNVFSFEKQGISYLNDKVLYYPDKYCFYLKNSYDVVKFNNNEWGDIYSDITILGDTNIHISTSKNESNINDQGLFSIITSFSSTMSETILFINTNIANFYLAMPLLLRMFILASLTILFVKYLINMLVR